MTVRPVIDADQPQWAGLRDALWPGSPAAHDQETRGYFEHRFTAPVVFVAEEYRRLVGFLELDFRKYAPGCESSPVPFIEGWYVVPEWRGHGVGRALIEAAEAHLRAAGFREMASDADVSNVEGIAAHAALGFDEIERVVCFRRPLRDA